MRPPPPSSPQGALRVTSPIPKGYHSLPVDLDVDDIVFEFKGNTYGCCTDDEIAISLTGPDAYPFHGAPRASVRPLSTSERTA